MLMSYYGGGHYDSITSSDSAQHHLRTEPGVHELTQVNLASMRVAQEGPQDDALNQALQESRIAWESQNVLDLDRALAASWASAGGKGGGDGEEGEGKESGSGRGGMPNDTSYGGINAALDGDEALNAAAILSSPNQLMSEELFVGNDSMCGGGGGGVYVRNSSFSLDMDDAGVGDRLFEEIGMCGDGRGDGWGNHSLGSAPSTDGSRFSLDVNDVDAVNRLELYEETGMLGPLAQLFHVHTS
jgi:hypothetical protein